MMRDIWIFLFVLGLILFTWPFMSIFSHNLAIYLFSAWLVLIVLIILLTLVKHKGEDGG